MTDAGLKPATIAAAPGKLSLHPIAAALDHTNPARHMRKRAGFSFVLTLHSSHKDANPEPLIQALDLLCLYVFYLAGLSGSTTVNVVPSPGLLSTVISPLHRSTILLTSDRPRPLPWVAWAVSP